MVVLFNVNRTDDTCNNFFRAPKICMPSPDVKVYSDDSQAYVDTVWKTLIDIHGNTVTGDSSE